MPRYTGSEIITKYLIKEGVKYVIGIPGHGCLPLVDSFLKDKDKALLFRRKDTVESALYVNKKRVAISGA